MNFLNEFNKVIDYWIAELDQYDIPKLALQPCPGQWSVGQLYMHLIEDTDFYLQQIRTCFKSVQHAEEQASDDARSMFFNNSFPDIRIEGGASHASMPQPASKTQLQEQLTRIRCEMNQLANQFSDASGSGKTRHPGLGYFSAVEWLQFAGMHFRHHLRQKKRIDDFLFGTDS
jgi:hypothetical protein